MPRQRNRYSRRTYVLPEDFPQRLKLFQGESGLSWSEVARLIGTYQGSQRALPETLRGVPWSAAASAHAAARYAHHDGHEGVDDGPKLSVGLVVGRQRAKPVPEEQDEHSNCPVENRVRF